jgi:hypothetical protein
MRYRGLAEVAAARIESRAGLWAPVVIYDVTVDGAQAAEFTKHVRASAPGALDALHSGICSGDATFEIIGKTGTRLAGSPVIPSNTGKC